MICARSRPRAAVLDTTEDGALPRKMVRAMRRAVPTWHSHPHQGCGSDRANLRPRISPAEPPWCLIWALTFAPGKGVSGNSKEDFVCCAHERASVIARLPAADRARIFSAKSSMTMTAEAARLLEWCQRAARPIANTPALTKRTAGPHWARP